MSPKSMTPVIDSGFLGVCQYIAGGQVVIDHLRPEASQPGKHIGVETVEKPCQQCPVIEVVDVDQQAAEMMRMLDIPQQLITGAGMKKAAQGPGQAAAAFTQFPAQGRCCVQGLHTAHRQDR